MLEKVAAGGYPQTGSESAKGGEQSQSSEWRTLELKELEDAINAALREEGLAAASSVFLDSEVAGEGGTREPDNSEPESEAAAATQDVVPAVIERLRQAVTRQVITPLLEAPWPDAEEDARPLRQLPLFVEHMTLLLKKTWGLACVRCEHMQKLATERAAAEAEINRLCERLSQEEAKRLAAEAEAGQGEQAHDMLEGTVTRLTAARKTIKEKEWELVEARRRLDQLERERNSQDRRIRDFETALERHVHAQSEAERRCSQAQADADAAQQRGELRRQLASAELKADRAMDDAMAATKREVQAEQQVADLQVQAEQQVADLQAQLQESQAQLLETRTAQEAIERRLRCELVESRSAQEAIEQRLQRELQESQAAKDSGSSSVDTADVRAHGEQRAAEHREMRVGDRPARRSVGGVLPRSGFGVPVPARTPPKVRHSQGGARGGLEHSPSAELHTQEGQQQPTLARPASLKAMPPNLRTLGKLLAGSGVLPQT